ncbi:MAG: voltage-gated potassium channel [Methanoregulaceae archaeon PtaB.Bin108]|nr:MAG: voltage-gated potassium channel [Methanoregulaceae archaeon PtaB.Bin108]
MSNPIIDILNALGSLLRFGVIPFYTEMRSGQFNFLQILAAAFAGSGSAGVIIIYFRDKIRQIPLYFCNDHVILCGVNETTETLVQQFRDKKTKTVVIGAREDSYEAENIRRSSTVMLSGDPKNPAVLSLARLNKASSLLALTGSDGMNAEIALSAMKIREKRKGDPLTCILQINNTGLWKIIREQVLLPGSCPAVRVDFYNGPALGARYLLGSYFFPGVQTASAFAPLLIVVGAGSFGENIIAGASRKWFETRPLSVPLQVLLVDIRAREIKERLLMTYPCLGDTANIHAVSVDVRSAEFQSGSYLKSFGSYSSVLVFICLDDDTAGLTAALALSHHLVGRDARILVRMDHNPGLAALVKEMSPETVPIIPYNSLSFAARPDLVLGGIREILARAIHDQYLANKSPHDTGQNDAAMVPWDDLPERFRESNRLQAEGILEKLRAVGCDILPLTDWKATSFSFTPEEIEYLAEMEHVRWMEAMKTQGFSFGSIKDEQKKTHPSMVPYIELSESEKEKDRDTVRMIPYYLGLIDFQVYRPERNPADGAIPVGGRERE